jgi:hypothetical protein
MTVRAALEVDTLTIRIPIRLKRRGGRKLIMTPEGLAAPARKPGRDETLVKALIRAHRWRRKIESGQAKSITDLAEQDARRCAQSPRGTGAALALAPRRSARSRRDRGGRAQAS